MVARLERLPPNARISKDQPAPAAERKRRARSAVTSGAGRWRCACGLEFDRYEGVKGAEAHADAAGHHRIDVVLR